MSIMEMRSKEVMGPGCSLTLWNVWLFIRAMSGDIVLLCVIRVSKCGHICSNLSLFISVFRLRPTGLLLLGLSIGCLAFKSPIM